MDRVGSVGASTTARGIDLQMPPTTRLCSGERSRRRARLPQPFAWVPACRSRQPRGSSMSCASSTPEPPTPPNRGCRSPRGAPRITKTTCISGRAASDLPDGTSRHAPEPSRAWHTGLDVASSSPDRARFYLHCIFSSLRTVHKAMHCLRGSLRGAPNPMHWLCATFGTGPKGVQTCQRHACATVNADRHGRSSAHVMCASRSLARVASSASPVRSRE